MLGRINPDWRERYEVRKCAMLTARARALGISVSDYVEAAERNIRAWVADAAIRIRVNEMSLTSFLRDNKYKVMEVTGTSGGDLESVSRRREVEHEILDVGIDWPASTRPVSGYLEGSDEAGPISTYGSIVLELDARVRSSTWFLLGGLVDTPTLGFGETVVPSPILHPSITAASGRQDAATAKALADVCGPRRYAEALIYGGVTPDDLTRVTYTQGLRPSDEVFSFSRGARWEIRTTAGPRPGRAD
jgi:hypothetical protein